MRLFYSGLFQNRLEVKLDTCDAAVDSRYISNATCDFNHSDTFSLTVDIQPNVTLKTIHVCSRFSYSLSLFLHNCLLIIPFSTG